MVWYGMVDVCDGYLAAEARTALERQSTLLLGPSMSAAIAGLQ